MARMFESAHLMSGPARAAAIHETIGRQRELPADLHPGSLPVPIRPGVLNRRCDGLHCVRLRKSPGRNAPYRFALHGPS
jgi:hypothetical protein